MELCLVKQLKQSYRASESHSDLAELHHIHILS